MTPNDLQTKPMTCVVDVLDDMASDERSTVGEGVKQFGSAGFEALVLVPAVLLVSPLSGIPLFSTLSGLLIVMFALQGAMGRENVWLPRRVMAMQVSANRLDRAADSLRWMAGHLDRLTRRRLLFLVTPPLRRGVLGLVAVAATIFPLLEFVPFSSTILGGAITLFALALLARDGLLVIVGFVLLSIAAAVPVTLVAAIV